MRQVFPPTSDPEMFQHLPEWQNERGEMVQYCQQHWREENREGGQIEDHREEKAKAKLVAQRNEALPWLKAGYVVWRCFENNERFAAQIAGILHFLPLYCGVN
jgi:hypothetical protein